MIVFRESQRENLGFADFHATNRIFEFRQHLFFTQNEREVFGLATFEFNAVDTAGEIDGYAVAILRGYVVTALAVFAVFPLDMEMGLTFSQNIGANIRSYPIKPRGKGRLLLKCLYTFIHPYEYLLCRVICVLLI